MRGVPPRMLSNCSVLKILSPPPIPADAGRRGQASPVTIRIFGASDN